MQHEFWSFEQMKKSEFCKNINLQHIKYTIVITCVHSLTIMLYKENQAAHGNSPSSPS